MCLRMVRPMQVDGIWDKSHLAYDKYIPSLVPPENYSRLRKLVGTNVTDFFQECNATWSAAWKISGAVCGNEALVPHTGGRCLELSSTLAVGPILQASNCTSLRTIRGGYVFDVYLHTGRGSKVRLFESCCGEYDTKGV